MASNPTSLNADQCVSVQLVDDVLVLFLPDEQRFSDLRNPIIDALADSPSVLQASRARIHLGNRDLDLFDLRRIITILKEEFQLEVSALYVAPESAHRFAERELRLKLFSIDDLSRDEPSEDTLSKEPETAPEPQDSQFEALMGADAPHRARFLHRTLRSGRSAYFEGDIVLFGDVNPGAQLIATGNIVILGALKGMAHAGANGDENTFIMAHALRPTQLRIGRHIAIPPIRNLEPTDFKPECARVEGDRIVIGSYDGRIFR